LPGAKFSLRTPSLALTYWQPPPIRQGDHHVGHWLTLFITVSFTLYGLIAANSANTAATLAYQDAELIYVC